MKHILILPGDGIGPEVTAQAVRILQTVLSHHQVIYQLDEALIGGAALDACGEPLPQDTLHRAQQADAVLLGAVGGPRWDQLPAGQRPERGLLALRAGLCCFANLRPIKVMAPLLSQSALKNQRALGVDLVVVRELTGGLYFSEPRGMQREPTVAAWNTMRYEAAEIDRIAQVAFQLAERRSGKLVSVDKANVLEVSRLWRERVDRLAHDHPGVAVQHQYVDNAAMQLVLAPQQFDVLLTENMFGDILSDVGGAVVGSLGLLPSASLNAQGKGIYEPLHGTAPDLAGRDVANPIGAMLSVAMLLDHGLGMPAAAQAVRTAVEQALRYGRTTDLAVEGLPVLGTVAFGDLVLQVLHDEVPKDRQEGQGT